MSENPWSSFFSCFVMLIALVCLINLLGRRS